MKFIFLIVGLIIGSLGMVLLLKKSTSASIDTSDNSHQEYSDKNWKWHDSLDALVAASNNHQLVFQNDQFRVLKVTVTPGVLDPIHTHKGKSIVWVTKTSPLLYHVYDNDAYGNLKPIRTDSINVLPSELFIGSWEKPESPHSVENIGKDTFELYRIEFKNKN